MKRTLIFALLLAVSTAHALDILVDSGAKSQGNITNGNLVAFGDSGGRVLVDGGSASSITGSQTPKTNDTDYVGFDINDGGTANFTNIVAESVTSTVVNAGTANIDTLNMLGDVDLQGGDITDGGDGAFTNLSVTTATNTTANIGTANVDTLNMRGDVDLQGGDITDGGDAAFSNISTAGFTNTGTAANAGIVTGASFAGDGAAVINVDAVTLDGTASAGFTLAGGYDDTSNQVVTHTTEIQTISNALDNAEADIVNKVDDNNGVATNLTASLGADLDSGGNALTNVDEIVGTDDGILKIVADGDASQNKATILLHSLDGAGAGFISLSMGQGGTGQVWGSKTVGGLPFQMFSFEGGSASQNVSHVPLVVEEGISGDGSALQLDSNVVYDDSNTTWTGEQVFGNTVTAPEPTNSTDVATRDWVIDRISAQAQQTLYGATNTHPVLTDSQSMFDDLPVSGVWTGTAVLNVGTNLGSVSYYTNAVDEEIPKGTYDLLWFASFEGLGNPTVDHIVNLIVSDGTTTNVLAVSTAVALSTEITLRSAHAHNLTNWVKPDAGPWYLGVRSYYVRTGGSSATATMLGGSTTYDTHMDTPSLVFSESTWYNTTAGDVVGMGGFGIKTLGNPTDDSYALSWGYAQTNLATIDEVTNTYRMFGANSGDGDYSTTNTAVKLNPFVDLVSLTSSPPFTGDAVLSLSWYNWKESGGSIGSYLTQLSRNGSLLDQYWRDTLPGQDSTNGLPIVTRWPASITNGVNDVVNIKGLLINGLNGKAMHWTNIVVTYEPVNWSE